MALQANADRTAKEGHPHARATTTSGACPEVTAKNLAHEVVRIVEIIECNSRQVAGGTLTIEHEGIDRGAVGQLCLRQIGADQIGADPKVEAVGGVGIRQTVPDVSKVA